MPKVSEFLYMVDLYKKNIPGIEARFIKKCGGDINAEINHTRALNALDDALLNGGKPITPCVGQPTTSWPRKLKVPEKNKRLARQLHTTT